MLCLILRAGDAYSGGLFQRLVVQKRFGLFNQIQWKRVGAPDAYVMLRIKVEPFIKKIKEV